MYYPTPSEVQQASHEQLARWHRFLPSPGFHAAGTDAYDEVVEREAAVLAEICSRFEEMGGWTPELIISIGHD